MENNHVPKKLFKFFSKFRRRIFADLKTRFSRSLEPLPTYPYPHGVIGKKFWVKSSESPFLLQEMVLQRTKYYARTNSEFPFRCQKSTLRIKVQSGSRTFRRRHMGVAANNFRRFREPKLQDTIRHRYLWLKCQIFSLVNNWDLKYQNKKNKKWILGRDSLQF